MLLVTDGIDVLIVMGSTDVRVYFGQRQGRRKWWAPLSSAPSLTCVAARAEQRHTRGRHDNARCRLRGLEARSTVVVSPAHRPLLLSKLGGTERPYIERCWPFVRCRSCL